MVRACRLVRRRYIAWPLQLWRRQAAEKARLRRLLRAAAQRLLAGALARHWQAWRAAVKVMYF